MNFKKLEKQLRREIAAHPAKAGVLGLMFLAATYFWVPLVWKWTVGDKPSGSPATAAAQPVSPGVPPPASAAPAATATTAATGTLGWRELVKRMDADPRMVPAQSWRMERDPFRLPPGENAAVENPEAAADLAPKTPAELGLVLSSTIVGPRRSTALLGGKTYVLLHNGPQQSQPIVVVEQAGAEYPFKLIAIMPRKVILEDTDDRQHELSMKEPDLAGRIGREPLQELP